MIASAPIAVTRQGVRVRHLGTVACGGPCDPALAGYVHRALDEAGVRALDFVSARFGGRFDAVNAALRRRRPLSWGFWHLSGESLAICLGRWKAADSASFDECLATRGLDIGFELDEEGKLAAPFLEYRSAPRGRAVYGESAEAIVAGDPYLVAALARGGRCKAAQFAQMQSVVVDALLPALTLPLANARCSLGEALKTARGRAVAFYTHLSFGTSGVAHLAAEVDRLRKAGHEALEPWVSAFARRVREAGAARPAHDLMRILSSPELTS